MVISFVWQKSFLANFTHQREYPRRSELKFQFWKSKSLTWKKFWLNDTNGWIQSFTDCAKHILFISLFCSCESSVSFHFANQERTCNIENNNIINLFPNPDSSVFWSFIKFCRIVIYSRDEAELCALVAGIWRHSCESWCKNAFDTNFNCKIQRLKHLNEIKFNWMLGAFMINFSKNHSYIGSALLQAEKKREQHGARFIYSRRKEASGWRISGPDLRSSASKK